MRRVLLADYLMVFGGLVAVVFLVSLVYYVATSKLVRFLGRVMLRIRLRNWK